MDIPYILLEFIIIIILLLRIVILKNHDDAFSFISLFTASTNTLFSSSSHSQTPLIRVSSASMASNSIHGDGVSGSELCINDVLRDDEMRYILGRVEAEKDKETFGLVCKRWLRLQSTERKKLAARAGPHMLRKMADRFTRLLELDLSQSVSRSFFPGVTDSDLAVVASSFTCLKILNLQNCKGSFPFFSDSPFKSWFSLLWFTTTVDCFSIYIILLN